MCLILKVVVMFVLKLNNISIGFIMPGVVFVFCCFLGFCGREKLGHEHRLILQMLLVFVLCLFTSE